MKFSSLDLLEVIRYCSHFLSCLSSSYFQNIQLMIFDEHMLLLDSQITNYEQLDLNLVIPKLSHLYFFLRFVSIVLIYHFLIKSEGEFHLILLLIDLLSFKIRFFMMVYEGDQNLNSFLYYSCYQIYVYCCLASFQLLKHTDFKDLWSSFKNY